MEFFMQLTWTEVFFACENVETYMEKFSMKS